MTISEIFLLMLCLSSALGGAVLTGVIVYVGNDCAITTPQTPKEADAKFWSSQSTRGGAKGY